MIVNVWQVLYIYLLEHKPVSKGAHFVFLGLSFHCHWYSMYLVILIHSGVTDFSAFPLSEKLFKLIIGRIKKNLEMC